MVMMATVGPRSHRKKNTIECRRASQRKKWWWCSSGFHKNKASRTVRYSHAGSKQDARLFRCSAKRIRFHQRRGNQGKRQVAPFCSHRNTKPALSFFALVFAGLKPNYRSVKNYADNSSKSIVIPKRLQLPTNIYLMGSNVRSRFLWRRRCASYVHAESRSAVGTTRK